MNNQVRQRLFMTLVALSLLWLLCMGVINLLHVHDLRSLALADCIKDNFALFDICYRKTNQEIQPSLLNYISPFLPVIILLWVCWVFKVRFQIDASADKKRIRKFIVGLVYSIGVLGFSFPFFIVLEKEVERLHEVLFHYLFLVPWLAISWISAPIFFQRLLDYEVRITEFVSLHKVAYLVAASPILAFVLLLIRHGLQF